MGHGLGGFALSSHHVLNANTGILFMGAGEKQRALTLEGGPGIVGATSGAILDELPLDLVTAGAFALGADGSVYYFQYNENSGDQQIKLVRKGPLGSISIVSSFNVCIPDSEIPDLCDSGQLTPPKQFVVLSDTLTYYLSAGKLFRVDSNTVTEISAIGSLGEACATADIATRSGQVFVACDNDLIGGWVGTFSNSETAAPTIERIAGGGAGVAVGAAPTDYRLGTIVGIDRAANADLYVAHTIPTATLTRFSNLGAQNVVLPAGTQELIGVAALNDGVYLTAQDSRAWRHVFSLDLSGNARNFIGNFLGDVGQNSVAPAFGNNQTIAQRERWPNASAPKIGPDGSIFLSHLNKVRRFAPSSLFTPYASLPEGYQAVDFLPRTTG